MKAIITAIRLVVFPTALVALAAVLSTRLLFAPPGRREPLRAELQLRACRILCWIVGVDVRVSGHSPTGAAYLAVCNHIGVLDGIILGSALPTAFVAKAEMANWPVVGWVCRVIGVIFVDRDRRMQTGEFVSDVQDRIHDGVTVTVFPEGTVGDERQLLPFRTGAFESVAGEPDLGVLPMFMKAELVDGSKTGLDARRAIGWNRGETMRRHSLRVMGHRRSVVQVRIGQPIPTAGRDRKYLARASRDAVSRLWIEASIES